MTREQRGLNIRKGTKAQRGKVALKDLSFRAGITGKNND
jgi:hypothetical protein